MKTQDIVREVDAMADSINAQTSTINSLSGAVENQNSTIGTLSESVNAQNSTINSLTGTVSEQSTALNTISQTVSEQESSLDSLAETVSEHASSLSNITEVVSAIEGPDYYGTTTTDITQLYNNCFNEKYINNAATEIIHFGTKGANGPKATIFLRFNPLANVSFIGDLRLYLSNIPSGMTTFIANIWFNDTHFVNNALFIKQTNQDYQMYYAFNYSIFYQTSVSNKFVIEFNDPALADMVLDKIMMIVTSGRNFMVLNRDNTLVLKSLKYTSYSWCFGPHRDGGVYNYYLYNNVANYNSLTFNKTYCNVLSGERQPFNNYSICIYRSSATSIPGLTTALAYELCVVGENNSLYSAIPVVNSYKFQSSNVLSADYFFNNSNTAQFSGYIGTTYAMELFYGYLGTVESKNSFKLNNVNLPNEFIDAVGVHDYWYMDRREHTDMGFCAVHKSGYILYFPSANSEYFVIIGTGAQVHAYIQEDKNYLNIYYKFNNNIVKKPLKFENGKWKILEREIKHYPLTKLYELGAIKKGLTRNSTWETIA